MKNTDLASLVSRIEQLEQQDKILRKYLVSFKRQLDNLTEQFNKRPEIENLERLQGEIFDLQQSWNQGAIESDDEDNFDADEPEQEKEIDVDVRQNAIVTALSDEEFKVERMLLLLNHIYATEEKIKEKTISAEELLRRYKSGERDFNGFDFTGANLSGNKWKYINIIGSNFRESNFCEAEFIGAIYEGQIYL
jgi:hypothetical protein